MNSSASAVTFNADGSRMFTAGGMQLKLPFCCVPQNDDAISFVPAVVLGSSSCT